MNSHYNWLNLIDDLQEVLRVLKPGGYLALIGESYKGGKYEKRDRKFMEIVNAAQNSPVSLLYSSRALAIQTFRNLKGMKKAGSVVLVEDHQNYSKHKVRRRF